MIRSVGYAGLGLNQLLNILPENFTLIETRSVPYSRYMPEFNRECLLEAFGVNYKDKSHVFGARSEDPDHYDENGRINFNLVIKEPLFRKSLSDLARQYSGDNGDCVLLCACKHPERCHRTLLVSEALFVKEGVDVEHHKHDGTTELHSDLRRRLADELHIVPDLFDGPEQCVEKAIEQQRASFAYVNPDLALSKDDNSLC